MSVLNRLLSSIRRGPIPFDLASKTTWKRASSAYLKHLAFLLEAPVISQWFTPVGPRYSGDSHILLQRSPSTFHVHLIMNLEVPFLTAKLVLSPNLEPASFPSACISYLDLEDEPYVLNILSSLLERSYP